MRRLEAVISVCLFTAAGLTAQDQLIRESSFSERRKEVRSLPPDPVQASAADWAREVGMPVRTELGDGRIMAVRRIRENGHPEYLITHNRNAAATTSTNRVWDGGGAGLALTGAGIVVGIWDGGIFRHTHQEFGTRGRAVNQFAQIIGHSTHVTGTIGAAGIDPDARGMAGGSILEGYDWDNDLTEMETAAGDGLLLSNHSYGFITGYNYNNDEDRWEWWGDTDISGEEDYLFGFYHEEAQSYDRIAYSHPYYLIVKSAGNDRGEGPSPGAEHYIWDNGWVASTEPRPRDGGPDGYGSIGPVGTAKNILAVGAVRDLPNGYTNPGAVQVLGFSVFGPTDDGRIKPDVVGNGESLYSTYSGSDSDYRNSSGTSMSAPNITGSMALLQQHHFETYGEYMRSASLRGLVIHTADDAGNPGPDYQYGWGLMNTRSAARIIGDDKYRRIQERTLETGEEYRVRLFSEGGEPIRVTLSWTDLPGPVPQRSLNPSDRILVNDLDLRVVRVLDSREFRPFVLDPVQPGLPAVPGDNVLDNKEQVLIPAADKGFYEIVVTHKGVLSQERQAFSLIVSGLAEEFFADGTVELTADNGSFLLTSAGEYLPDMEAGWRIAPENGSQVSLYFNFFETEEGVDRMKVYDGSDTTAPVLAVLSGSYSESDTVITSSNGGLLVSFESDNQVQDRGFEAYYCTAEPEGNFLIEGEEFPCEGSLVTYVAAGQKGTFYRWGPPDGWTVADTGDHWVTLEAGASSGTIEVLPFNRCGVTDPVTLFVDPLDAVPELTTFTGDTVLCAGEPGLVSVDSLPGASYQWILPDNWLGTSITQDLSFIPSMDQGSIRVIGSNACGRGDTVTIPLRVKTVPKETLILPLSERICQNSTARFFLVPDADNQYTWSVESDWSILGDAARDTVDVQIGETSNYLFVEAFNECGARISNRFFLASPEPDPPLLMASGSSYGDYRKLEIQNSTSFEEIRWYLDGDPIDSPGAVGTSYVPYLPGTYTVEVTNNDGCTLLMDPRDGLTVTLPHPLYAAYGSESGFLTVYNAGTEKATVNLYDMRGQLLLVREIDPGANRLATPGLTGVYIVRVDGTGDPFRGRVFLH